MRAIVAGMISTAEISVTPRTCIEEMITAAKRNAKTTETRPVGTPCTWATSLSNVWNSKGR